MNNTRHMHLLRAWDHRDLAPRRAEQQRREARWVSPSEYLFGRLFGKEALRVSISMASGTGLFNQVNCAWDAETLRTIDIPIEKLSPIVNLTERSQGLQPEFAVRWPALRDIPFFPAGGDGACGNVGSGCVSPTRFAINLGTSGAIRTVWDESEPGLSDSEARPKTAPRGLWRYRVDARRPVLGVMYVVLNVSILASMPLLTAAILAHSR